MSSPKDDTSDIKQAVDQINVDKIAENLQSKTGSGEPESLTVEQTTPFIDENTRTDKA